MRLAPAAGRVRAGPRAGPWNRFPLADTTGFPFPWRRTKLPVRGFDAGIGTLRALLPAQRVGL